MGIIRVINQLITGGPHPVPHENWKNWDLPHENWKNEGVPREKCWISAMKIGFHGENSELDN